MKKKVLLIILFLQSLSIYAMTNKIISNQEIMRAIIQGDLETVERFASDKINLDRKLSFDRSPLSFAIETLMIKNDDQPRWAIIETLLDAGAIKYQRSLTDAMVRKIERGKRESREGLQDIRPLPYEFRADKGSAIEILNKQKLKKIKALLREARLKEKRN